MKSQDLMIGDYIQDLAGDLCQVIVIDRQVAQVETLTGVHQGDTTRYLHEAEGVPLTPEILEKNGFEKKEDDYGQELYSLLLGEWAITYMSVSGCPYLTIEDVLDYDSSHNVLTLKDNVYNVHELQHALRLLDIDKGIKI